jgi:hypothetical protein
MTHVLAFVVGCLAGCFVTLLTTRKKDSRAMRRLRRGVRGVRRDALRARDYETAAITDTLLDEKTHGRRGCRRALIPAIVAVLGAWILLECRIPEPTGMVEATCPPPSPTSKRTEPAAKPRLATTTTGGATPASIPTPDAGVATSPTGGGARASGPC